MSVIFCSETGQWSPATRRARASRAQSSVASFCFRYSASVSSIALFGLVESGLKIFLFLLYRDQLVENFLSVSCKVFRLICFSRSRVSSLSKETSPSFLFSKSDFCDCSLGVLNASQLLVCWSISFWRRSTCLILFL